jgi:L-2,4-diaminobutyrate decarboxylase
MTDTPTTGEPATGESRSVADQLFAGGPQSAGRLVQAVGAFVTTLGEATGGHQPWSGIDPAELSRLVAAIDICPDDGLGLQGALDGIGAEVVAHGVQPWHPRTVAHLHAPTLLAAAAAEVAIGATNQSLDSFDQAPAATLLEDHLVRWLGAQIGLPASSSGVLTAGGTASNTLGLFLARRRAARRAGIDVDRHGIAAAGGRWRIVTSAACHVSVAQAAVLLGLGSGQVIAVDTDTVGRLDLADLDRRLAAVEAEGAQVMALVATAGTTDAGAVDPLGPLARRAADCGAWLHVDAAMGCALILSDRLRGRLAGIEHADSVTADLHKLWWQPIGAGALLVAEATEFDGMRLRDAYLNRAADGDEHLNLVTRSLDTSRRFDALKIVVGLRSVGRRQLAGAVEHLVALAEHAAAEVGRRPRLELVAEPSTVTTLFRWIGPFDEATLDRINTEIQRRLFATGRAILGRTHIGPRVTLKFTFVNPLATPEDVDALLDLVEAEADACI